MASWYGAPYHNRRGSNGEVYNMHAMTAAHRTLPLGSIVRVTNVKTGARGGGAHYRSRAVREGTHPRPLAGCGESGRRVPAGSCAGTGWMSCGRPRPLKQADAGQYRSVRSPTRRMQRSWSDHLQRRYRTAKVLRFASPDWRLVGAGARAGRRSRTRADLARETETPEGSVFLVRLD